MLHYNRNYFSKGINVKKTNASKECFICYYWYYLYKGIMFQLSACDGWQDVLMMSMNLKNIAIKILMMLVITASSTELIKVNPKIY